ncbi:hypothetical protein NMT12_200074 [metagenome]
MVALPRLELGLRASKAPVLDRYTTGLTKKSNMIPLMNFLIMTFLDKNQFVTIPQ